MEIEDTPPSILPEGTLLPKTGSMFAFERDLTRLRDPQVRNPHHGCSLPASGSTLRQFSLSVVMVKAWPMCSKPFLGGVTLSPTEQPHGAHMWPWVSKSPTPCTSIGFDPQPCCLGEGKVPQEETLKQKKCALLHIPLSKRTSCALPSFLVGDLLCDLLPPQI